MTYKLLEKAYEINFSKIEEGYLYSQAITYAENRNKAKQKLLKAVYYDNVCLQGEDDEVTYLTIPVIRCKRADRYDFEGQAKTKGQIQDILEERKRILKLDEILNNEDIEYCYIRKGSYYRPNSCGYTSYTYKAGIYSKEEAVCHAKSCKDIWLEIIDIEEHNKRIKDEIKDLKTRLI